MGLSEDLLEELEKLCTHSLDAEVKPRVSTEVAGLMLTAIAEVKAARAGAAKYWRTVLRSETGEEADPHHACTSTDAIETALDWERAGGDPDRPANEWSCVVQWRPANTEGVWLDYRD